MKKIIIGIIVLVVVVGGIIVFSGKKGTENNTGDNNQSLTGGNENKSTASGIADVCNYFPKELIESAIGKPIVKVETSIASDKSCLYYTTYSETYDHTPYGDKPGGTPIVVVYDDEDLAGDKITNEKHGSVYGSDASIGMDNYVVKNTAGKIWQTVLILGDEKYIRMHFVHDAVTGEDLVKIATKFAERINE
jgi:hypothetical protein